MGKPQEAMDGKYWMPCIVKDGVFSSERHIVFSDISYNKWVVAEYEGHTKPGYVAVWILDRNKDQCMIRIQNCQDFEQVWVPVWWE